LYACKIKETANGRWGRSRCEAWSTLQVIAEGCFTRHVQIDEQETAARVRKNETQGIA